MTEWHVRARVGDVVVITWYNLLGEEWHDQRTAPPPDTFKARRRIMLLERIARVCHEVNRVYCLSLGDTSQKSWEECPQWQKDSAVSGVEAVVSNRNITPEELHEEWVIAKRRDGWVYGPVKDEVTKQHPCLLPYAELPKEQKVKDELFQAVVRAMAFHPTQGTQDDRQSDK